MIKRMILILCLLAGGFTACSSDKDGPVALETAGDTPLNTPLPTPDAAQADLAVLEAAGGVLVFAQGTALYAYPHGDAETPVLITDDFEPALVALAPDRRTLFYSSQSASDVGAHDFMRVDMATLEPARIHEMIATWQFIGSSPDGAWIIIRNPAFGMHALRADGSLIYKQIGPSPATPHWLEDGSVLLIDQRQDSDGAPRILSLDRFDPATGTTTDLAQEFGLDLSALQADPSLLETALAAQGWAILPEDITAPRIVAPESTSLLKSACPPWQIVSSQPASETGTIDNVLYQSGPVYRLSELRALPDSSLLFLEWVQPGCDPLELPNISLKRLWPDGSTTTIAEGVYPGVGLGASKREDRDAPRTALSPDGRRVAWVAGSIEAGTSAIHLTDLETGEDSLVKITTGEGGAASAFVEQQMFTAVYWAAP